MRNKTVSLCDRSHKIASDMENFSDWLREQLLKYDPEHQLKIEKANKKHGYECIPCQKIFWYNKKLLSDEYCNYCNTKCVYLGHLDRRLYG
jgi:hypothetical protein